MNPTRIAEINAYFQRYNDAPLPAFSGLSPAQMHRLQYALGGSLAAAVAPGATR